MPCDEWRRIAYKANAARLQRDYLASAEVTYPTADQRREKVRQQTQTCIRASRKAEEHRHRCSICKVEPTANFRDLEPWNEKLKKRVLS
jgi:hypothetical protein